MMRNLIVLGCAGLLAFGLSVSSQAGFFADTDNDGVVDLADDCIDVDNGPDEGDPNCYAPGTPGVQLDGDHDGYGNPCDTDVNQDGATGLSDVSATLIASSAGSTNPIFDFNCDGATGLNDVSKALADSSAGATPGPSGLACADPTGATAPCP